MILLQTKKHILNWQLSDPKAGNSIGITMMSHLDLELTKLKKSLRSKSKSAETPKGLIISAVPHNGTWVAGGNLVELAKLKPASVKHYASTMARICLELTQLPIPVVVAVEGLVIGGGIELALAGDLIFATENSRFHFKQLDVGLCLGYGSNQRLVQAVGLCRAKNWVLTRQLVTSGDAKASGLVHELAATRDELWQKVEAYFDGLASIQPEVFARQKQLLYLAHQRHARINLAMEQKSFLSLWGNPQHEKYLAAFNHK